MAKKTNSAAKVSQVYPSEVVAPVKKYLGQRLFDLLKRKKEIGKEDPFKDPSRLNDNAAIDSDAAEQFGHMQVEAMRKTLDRTIIQIHKAMSRIKLGKYGVCEKCGNFIDTDRLMVMPETTLCINCEKRREK